MSERKIAVVEGFSTLGLMSQKLYDILLTERQMVFVEVKAPKTAAGAILGGVGGAILADSVAKRKVIDYDQVDPSALAADSRNIAVPYASAKGIRFTEGTMGYSLEAEYQTAQGKTRKVKGIVLGPKEVGFWSEEREPEYAEYLKATSQERSIGARRRFMDAAYHEYLRKAREAFRRAVPPAVSMQDAWKL